MQTNYTRPQLPSLIYVALLLFFVPLTASGQLMLERELVGGVSGYSAVSTDGNLQADATFGQPTIGYAEGDLIVTVGFQQGDKSALDNNAIAPPPPEGAPAVVNVSAYPNPTVERLVVDLNEHSEKFQEIRLINSGGITVRSTKTNGVTQVIFAQLERLPNANYFLQGVDKKGKLYQLGTVMIVTK